MKRWSRHASLLVMWGVMFIVGCGGGVFSTSKTLVDPFGLRGRSVNMNSQVNVDGLTTRLAADQRDALQFTLSDQSTAGNPYAGMSSMEVLQQATLTFFISSGGNVPSTFTLRDVHLRVTIQASESSSRNSPPIEFQYTGFLTLERQTDGSYRTRESLSFLDELDRFDGSALIAILTAGGTNTITVHISLTASASSPNIPSGSTVSFTLRFDDSSAIVRW
ncbi:MAG: hypothetical protein RMM08_06480 [Armatimonadota bacterium]|nr:hypothetical protein [bacterium]MDW8320989.1 hypothetical protein [Armatimonadota bacterium]